MELCDDYACCVAQPVCPPVLVGVILWSFMKYSALLYALGILPFYLGCKLLAGRAYMENYNQVACIICMPNVAWKFQGQNSIHPLGYLRMTKLRSCWTSRYRQGSYPDTEVMAKQRKKAKVTDAAITSDSNIRKNKNEKLEKYQCLREELEKMWRLKATVMPDLCKWLQHIPETTSKTLV